MLLPSTMIGGGVFGIEGQLEQGEVAVGRDGVGPGHVLVEADGHAGRAADGDAHHVQLAGQGQVHLVEAVGAFPGEVRVAEEHAGAVGRDVAPEGPTVAAEAHAFRLDGKSRGRRLAWVGPVGRGGGGGLAKPGAAAGLDRLLLVQPQHVVEGDGAHPAAVAAGGRAGGGGDDRRGICCIRPRSRERAAWYCAEVLAEAGAQLRHVHRGAEEDVAVQVRRVVEGDGGRAPSTPKNRDRSPFTVTILSARRHRLSSR